MHTITSMDNSLPEQVPVSPTDNLSGGVASGNLVVPQQPAVASVASQQPAATKVTADVGAVVASQASQGPPRITGVTSKIGAPGAGPVVIGQQIPLDPSELTKANPVAGQFGASTSTIHIVRWTLVGIFVFFLALGIFMLVQSGQLKEWWTDLVVKPIRSMSQPS